MKVTFEISKIFSIIKKKYILSLNYNPFCTKLLWNFFIKPKITRYVGVLFKFLCTAANYPYHLIPKIEPRGFIYDLCDLIDIEKEKRQI